MGQLYGLQHGYLKEIEFKISIYRQLFK